MGKKFIVHRKHFPVLVAWSQFVPRDEVSRAQKELMHRLLVAVFMPPVEGTDGHSIELTYYATRHVRDWFDYIPGVVSDDSDEVYAELLDEYLANPHT
jgi:hypothetical protein